MVGLFRRPVVWIGLAVSLGALFLAFRGLRWTEVAETLADANYGLLAVSLGLMLVALYVRAVRWAFLFYPRKDMGVLNLFGAINVGLAFSNILPLRVGEVTRAYVIAKTENVSSAQALSTIVVERTLDTLTVVALLMVTLPFIDAPGWAKGPALLLGVAFFALAVFLAILSANRARVMALVKWVGRFAPERFRKGLEGTAEAAIDGFAVLRQPAAMLRAAGWSLVSWMTSALMIFVVLRAFGLNLPFTAALFVMAATSLGMLVPSSPGYIGVFHAIAIESLVNVFDADRDRAASYAIANHAIFYLTPLVISAAYLWRQRYTWQQVRQGASEDTREAALAPAGETRGGLAGPAE